MASSQQTNGKKKIIPKDLDIVWGKDPRYWRFHENQSSEKLCYAELLQVCWLEVTTKFQGLEADKEYSVGFTISFNQDMFGWESCPMYLMAKVGKKGKYTWKKITIDPTKVRGSDPYNIPAEDSLVVKAKAGNSDESDVHVGLYEVWSGKWKGGLKIHSAFAQPKQSEQRVNLYSNPHWKSEGCCTYDPDLEGSFTVPVRELNIIWGNDIRFWQPIRFTEDDSQSTGFEEGRKLLQVNWLEVTVKIPTHVFHAKLYEIYYIVKFQIDAFGWHSVPIKFKVRLNGEELSERSIILETYRKKHDTWHEIHGGEFWISRQTGGNLEFGMFETESKWWKGGLVLAGVKIKKKPDGE